MLNSKTDTKLMLSLMAFISILTTIDVIGDFKEGTSLAHLSIEIMIILFTASGALYTFFKLQKKNNSLNTQLSASRNDAKFWKEKSNSLIEGLSKIIDEQFDNWSLSPSEKEVALLLIKGLSLNEIAIIRDTKERTVRTQATSLYKKASLGGRHELSAFFLEDLMI